MNRLWMRPKLQANKGVPRRIRNHNTTLFLQSGYCPGGFPLTYWIYCFAMRELIFLRRWLIAVFCDVRPHTLIIYILKESSIVEMQAACYWGIFVKHTTWRVRFPALPDSLRSSGSGTGSTQHREYNWGATWKKKKRLRSTKRDYGRRDQPRWPHDTSLTSKVGINFADMRWSLGGNSLLAD
jgi:hypothetical protein